MFYMRVAHHLTSIGDIGQCWHKLLGQKSTSFIWCIKPCKAFGTVLKYEKKKYLWGSRIFRNVTGCNNISKVSLLFNKAISYEHIFKNMHSYVMH